MNVTVTVIVYSLELIALINCVLTQRRFGPQLLNDWYYLYYFIFIIFNLRLNYNCFSIGKVLLKMQYILIAISSICNKFSCKKRLLQFFLVQ